MNCSEAIIPQHLGIGSCGMDATFDLLSVDKGHKIKNIRNYHK